MQVLLLSENEAGTLPSPPAQPPADGFVWIDCDAAQGREWVEPVRRLTGVEVFEDHLLDAENPHHPSFFDSTPLYEIVVFRGLTVPGPADEAARRQVRTRPTVFFLFPACLVTIRHSENQLVTALRSRLIAASEHQHRMPTSPEELMLRLLNQMVDRFLDLRQPLAEQVERWQRRLLDPRRPFDDWLPLLEMRAEARRLEQLCEEQLDAIQEWRDERMERGEPRAHGTPVDRRRYNGPMGEMVPDPAIGAAPSNPPPERRSSARLRALDPGLQVRATNVVEHIHRVLSHARRMEASVESAVQLHFSATAHRTNDVVRTLTTITAIFMPLTLITGIFGMNFEFMPGLHARTGFWITLGVMALIGLVLLGYFRARRILSLRTFEREQRRDPAAARPQ